MVLFGDLIPTPYLVYLKFPIGCLRTAYIENLGIPQRNENKSV